MLAATVELSIGDTLRLVVMEESQPAEEVKVTAYCPLVDTEDPSGKVKLSPAQIEASTLRLKVGRILRFVVMIESHPPDEVKVTSYKPAAVTTLPSGKV
jgi:hypothetical protein